MAITSVCDQCGTGVPPDEAEVRWWRVEHGTIDIEVEFWSPRCVSLYVATYKEPEQQAAGPVRSAR